MSNRLFQTRIRPTVQTPVLVLWVDSDDYLVASSNVLLQAHGWVIEHARTMFEALDRVARYPYDVVILDLQLADGLATDAWVYIRRLQPGVIGIITTHSSSLHSLIRIDAPGIVAYLDKPLHLDDILSIVTGALGDRRNRDRPDRSVII